ncbi:glycosyltransferase family 39 protein [Microcoleus sp. D3_18a_C4]|uniref:glycosyltransferase family 39 protein n=1 Tax=unclassified Microcoleus TaxID=2642155 RepID=UPI002FD097BA
MEYRKNGTRLNSHNPSLDKWVRVLMIVILVMGIFFRFANLDKKVYWIDEGYTSLRISGYTEAEFIQEFGDGQIKEIKSLQKYQRINADKSVFDTVKGLAIEEAQLTPLYFVAVRFWVQLFGDSIAVTRSLSAVFSVLALPCMYWLCLELFESSVTAWLAVAIIAVSPFQVVYAQEARPYSLFVMLILLSSAVLLRGMRRKTNSSWAIYAVTLVVGFYSHLLFGIVAIGHGVYVLIIEKFRFNKTVIGYLLASIAGLIALSPWIIAFIKNSGSAADKTSWLSLRIPVSELMKNWVWNISKQFFDVGIYWDLLRPYLISTLPVSLMILIMVGYSFYLLVSKTEMRVWLFVVTLTFVIVGILCPADLIRGGIRSINTRYMIPCYLGIQISLAYLFTQVQVTTQLQKLWRVALVVLLSIGIASCCLYVSADNWWNKDRSYINIRIARTVNSASKPLIITEFPEYSVDTIGNLLGMSHQIDPRAKLLLMSPKNNVEIPENFNEIFLYSITPQLKTKIANKSNQYKIQTIYEENDAMILGKIVNK